MDHPAGQLTDRRVGSRRRFEADVVRVRIRPGHFARLVELSTTGALLETPQRLLPGTHIHVSLDAARPHDAVRSQVVRCWVARIAVGQLTFLGAVRFERDLQTLPALPAIESEQLVPAELP